ncbi:hypothetical protein [Streptomyces shenzhenensis]|uniref:hypothetical protein n=1 Tax=Streptomyces shenzhenensis TaxID=943815 RepID=UPI00340627BA
MDEVADDRLAPPRSQDRIQLGHVVLGLGGLDAGEDVDGPVAELEAVAQVAGLAMRGSDDGEAHADGAGERAEWHGGCLLFQLRAILGFFRRSPVWGLGIATATIVYAFLSAHMQ